MRARDVMTTTVHTVMPDTRVSEIAKLLIDRHISAVPVVDNAGRLQGIVSEGDLMRRVESGTTKRRPWWLELLSDPDTLATEFVKSHGIKAVDVMTTDVITVEEDADLAVIAGTLEKHRIKRVPVVRRGKVVGIVSRANLLQGLAAAGGMSSKADASDQAVRDELWTRVKAQPWSSSLLLNIVVRQATAHLWGLVRSEEERKALCVTAETTPGIKAVEDHLTVRNWTTAL
jgi:CBS domain-containing protein